MRQRFDASLTNQNISIMNFKLTTTAREILTCITICFSIVAACGQTGYKIDFKIKGFKEPVAYLGYYFWDKTYVADTAQVGSNGSFTFDGKKALPQGLYMLVTKDGSGTVNLFDFIVGTDQEFLLETNQENLMADIQVAGDLDNRIFFDHLRHNNERAKEAQPFIATLRDSLIMEKDKVEAREKFNQITTRVKAYQNDLLKKFPTTVTARIIRAYQEIEIPEAPIGADGKKDPAFAYRYYKKHYWDNFDLGDEVMIRLRTSLYQDKLKTYLDKMVVQTPDSIMKEIDALAKIARKNKETYKFLVWKCITEYQQHPIMGMDAVYVHLSDQYLATGEMDFWMDQKSRKNFIDYASQLRRSLIGQKAANLIMQDQNFQPRNMYDISKRYTILFIFDPDCPHCREETPKLVDFYKRNQKKFDFEVFAVCSDSSMKKMRNFIKEMDTPWITVNGPRSYVGSYDNLYDAKLLPSLYIIDDKKNIIAKKPPIEKLEEFLTHYELASNQKK